MNILHQLFSSRGTMTAREAKQAIGLLYLTLMGTYAAAMFWFTDFGTIRNAADFPAGSMLLLWLFVFVPVGAWIRYAIMTKRARARGINDERVDKNIEGFLFETMTGRTPSRKTNRGFGEIVYEDDEDDRQVECSLSRISDRDLKKRARELRLSARKASSTGPS